MQLDYSDIIKPLARERGIRSLSRDTGINRSSIGHWLTDHQTMPLERQLILAEALGCDVMLSVRPPTPRKKSRKKSKKIDQKG